MGTAATKSQAWGRKVVALATIGPHPFQVDGGAAAASREVPLESKHLRQYEDREWTTRLASALDPLGELTARQLAVWFLVRVSRAGHKFSRKEIAATLHCSRGTVDAEYRRVVNAVGGAEDEDRRPMTEDR